MSLREEVSLQILFGLQIIVTFLKFWRKPGRKKSGNEAKFQLHPEIVSVPCERALTLATNLFSPSAWSRTSFSPDIQAYMKNEEEAFFK